MRVKNKGTESRPTLATSDDLHDEKASLGFEPQFKVLSSRDMDPNLFTELLNSKLMPILEKQKWEQE